MVVDLRLLGFFFACDFCLEVRFQWPARRRLKDRGFVLAEKYCLWGRYICFMRWLLRVGRNLLSFLTPFECGPNRINMENHLIPADKVDLPWALSAETFLLERVARVWRCVRIFDGGWLGLFIIAAALTQKRSPSLHTVGCAEERTGLGRLSASILHWRMSTNNI